MTDSQESYKGPQARASISPATTPPKTVRMNDLTTQYSPAQIEAQEILRHIIASLSNPASKYYNRYCKWLERHPRLDDFCFRCIRPQVWSYLNGRWSLDALKLIAGDLRADTRAIYLNGILGLDKSVRIYIGQASSLRPRIAQHLNFRYRRDNPSLHYHALQSSIYNAIGVLAVLPSPNMGGHALPGMDDPALLLNLLEMWMGLVFRTLPTAMMEEWMPGDISPNRKEGKEGVFGGLNIRCPLDQGDIKACWVDLSESDDPLVREYVGVPTFRQEGLESQQNDIEKRKRELQQTILEQTEQISETIKTQFDFAMWRELKKAFPPLAETNHSNVITGIFWGAEWVEGVGEEGYKKVVAWRKYRVPFEQAFAVQCGIEGFCGVDLAEEYFIEELEREKTIEDGEEEY
ncbi:hypothetical protein SVAN01_03186 [Stagonosporopsis vannaccii]|nr:hypothetical protein SVAN01_03186 [Stagonosporopsis vannaccii]